LSDFDNPWKEALELFFQAFLEFFFPQVLAAIDWSRGYENLDKELQQVVREAAIGRRFADKLFKVWLKDGQEAWILIHVEVQSQRDDEFPERMFVYHYRIYDRYRRPVISLAVLGDDEPNWRPNQFGYSLCGCTIGLEFPVVKLLDFADNEVGLESNRNPFACLVLAHLKTLETRQDSTARKSHKIRLIKSLYERGFAAEQIRLLFALVDWIMDLPESLEKQLREELAQFEEDKPMGYANTIAGLAHRQGKAETLIQILERRNENKVPDELAASINAADLATLEQWVDLALQANSLEDFRRQANL
jgi:hypothetical protein